MGNWHKFLYLIMQKIVSRLLLFLICNISFSTYYAQSDNEGKYDLLWRIEGNGLTKPSYLFGTMHVKDVRAFNFSDSVMTSIEKCDVFALELHPDSMVYAMFKRSFDRDTSNTLKKTLSETDYKKLEEQFEEINGYSIDELKSRNPVVVGSLLRKRVSKPTDKNTFVDAYLYGIAKTFSKEIVGLEQIETQLDLFYGGSEEEQKETILGYLKYETEEYQDYYDSFVETYGKGELKEIENSLKDSDFQNTIMNERNVIMTESMIKIMKEKSLFAAVGAAHLIGDKGVVGLLRAAGYTVSAVDATFTGVADKYQIDLSKMKWKVYKNEEFGYSIEMPGTPFPINKYEPMKMRLFSDLTTSAVFSVNTIDFRGNTLKYDEAAIIKRILNRYKKSETTKIVKKRKINKNGFSATELILRNKSNSRFKIQLFIKNNILYVLFAGMPNAKLDQPYINRFFESFKNHELPAFKSKNWELFDDKEGAFSILLPNEPQEIKREVSNPLDEEGDPYIFNMLMSTHVPNMTNYIVAYNDLPLGYYMDSKNDEGFKLLIEEIKMSNTIIGDVDTIWLDGVKGIEFRLMLKDIYFSTMRIYIRGNRVYKLIKQNLTPEIQTQTEDDFFSSYSFSGYEPPTFQTLEPEGENFSILQFSESKIVVDSTVDYSGYGGEVTSCYTTNPNSGGVYLFEYFTLTEYFNVQHIDTFYADFIDQIRDWADTIVSVDSIFMDGIYGKEVLLENTWTDGLSRYRLWLDNNKAYLASAFIGRDELFSEETNTYFESFKKTKESDLFDIYVSKAQLIMTDLTAEDTLVYQKALGALNYHKFDKEDLPLMYETLFQSFPDDTTNMGARSNIITSIELVDEVESIDKLKTLYKEKGTTDPIKSTILTSLVEFSDPKGFSVYLDLFLNSPPDVPESTWSMFWPLSDSLELVADNLDQLLPMLENEEYKSNVLSLAINLLDKDTLPYTKLVTDHFNELTKYALQDVEVYFKEKEVSESLWYYKPEMYNYLSIMRGVKNQPITDQYTTKLLAGKASEDLIATVMAVRIVNGLTVDKKKVKKLMDNEDTRYEMIVAYNETGQMEAVPKKYRNNMEIGRLKLRNYIYEGDDYYPDEVKLLGEITANDSIFYVYSYSYSYEEVEGEKYIGLAGPFKSGSDSINLSKVLSYSDWDLLTTDWKSQAKKMLSDFEKYAY